MKDNSSQMPASHPEMEEIRLLIKVKLPDPNQNINCHEKRKVFKIHNYWKMKCQTLTQGQQS